MILEKLLLQNFRNYSKKVFEFSEKTNLIIGPNAVGKTNILEAIYFLASGRSFRVKGVEREAIRYGEELGRIHGKIANCEFQITNYEGKNELTELEIVLTAGEVIGEKTAKKRYFVNGVGKRQLDFLGNLRTVYFGPEDLELVTDSPSLRRKYLDSVLVQIDREYARAGLSYEKGLRQRNKLLEEMRETGITDKRRLFFWDQLLIKNGNYITRKRSEFIEDINSFRGVRGFAPADAEAMAGKDFGDFKIEYDASIISEERLAKYSVEEMAAGVTLVGPHRDDFKIRINPNTKEIPNSSELNGRDLAVYGSRGEQRLAILWLKLGELLYIENETKDLPVLLLDDIFSELDISHRKLVFDLIGKYQTIMTTADIGMIEKSLLSKVKVLALS